MQNFLEDYLAYLRVKKGRARSEEHIKGVRRKVGRMLAGVDRLEAVTPESIEQRMRELLAEDVTIAGKLQRRTTQAVDAYRREFGTFLRWLVKKRRVLDKNPVDAVDPLEAEDARGVSRPLSTAEACTLFACSPRPRAIVYVFWATTGFRAGETRRLRWAHVVLEPQDGSVAYVYVLRSTAKNRKPVRQPLHPIVTQLLREARGAADEPVFPDGVPTSKTFLTDLEAAGLSGKTTVEGKLTRTSLRKLFASGLDRAGASEGVVQKLMRHSSPVLTRARYTDFDLAEKAHWVGQLDYVPTGLSA